MDESHKSGKRKQLTNIITAIMCKYTHFKYYQGYHDVASVFLLVLGENLAFYCLEAFTLRHLIPYMTKTFDKCIVP